MVKTVFLEWRLFMKNCSALTGVLMAVFILSPLLSTVGHATSSGLDTPPGTASLPLSVQGTPVITLNAPVAPSPFGTANFTGPIVEGATTIATDGSITITDPTTNIISQGGAKIQGSVDIHGVITNYSGINMVDDSVLGGGGKKASSWLMPNGTAAFGYNLLNVVMVPPTSVLWTMSGGLPVPTEIGQPYVSIGSSNNTVLWNDGNSYFGGNMGINGFLDVAGSINAFNINGGLINLQMGVTPGLFSSEGAPDFPGGFVSIASNKIVLYTSGAGYFSGQLSASNGLSVGATFAPLPSPANGAIIQGNVGIGTPTPNAALDINGSTIIIEQSATPADNTPCTAGTIWWDANYIYVCTRPGNVKRALLSSY